MLTVPDHWLVEGKVMGEARSGPEAGRLTPCTPGATAETHHHFDSDDEGGSSSSGSSNPAQLAQLEVHPNTMRRTASSALLLAAQITVTHLTVALPGRELAIPTRLQTQALPAQAKLRSEQQAAVAARGALEEERARRHAWEQAAASARGTLEGERARRRQAESRLQEQEGALAQVCASRLRPPPALAVSPELAKHAPAAHAGDGERVLHHPASLSSSPRSPYPPLSPAPDTRPLASGAG